MKRWGLLASLLTAAGAMYSCGGGGGTAQGPAPATSTTAPVAMARLATAYEGTFVGNCELVDNGTNVETGLPIYNRSQLTVSAPDGATARIALRFDFYADAACTDSPLGALSFSAPDNQLTIVGAAVVSGKNVDKVTLDIAAADQSPVSTAGGLAVFGTAVRLSVPSELFSGFSINDIWLPDESKLFYGGSTYGTDGFPVALDFTTADTKVTVAPAAPPNPCASAMPTWFVGGSPMCQASLPGSASGSTTLVQNTAPLATGSATFSCSNGTWSAPASASCASAPPPLLASSCAAATVTWTVNGVTCQSTTEAMATDSSRLVNNSLAANMGVAQFACTAGALQLNYGTCSVRPPPPPPLTDPLQIAQQRNCILCHSVTDPFQSVGGISMRVIADYYRSSPPPAGVLETKVKQGGTGTFGTLPMPANSQISDAELAIVIPWILSQ